MCERRVRVYLLCGNGLLKEFLARILAKNPDLEVVDDPSHAEGLEGLGDAGVDVVVFDSLQLLVEQGACLPAHQDNHNQIKCVLISMEEGMKEFLTAIQYGASGYVLREASAIEVVTAIRAVAQGRAVCPPSLTKVLFDFVVSQASVLPNQRCHHRFDLTSREQQLIPLINRGLTNKEIAA